MEACDGTVRLDAAIAFHRDVLGHRVVHQETNAEQGVREAMVAVGPAGAPGDHPTLLQLLAPTNKTVILGGSKQTDGRNQSTSTPLLDKIPILGKAFKGLARSKSQSQLVILLRSSVIPAPQTDPLVSQSI